MASNAERARSLGGDLKADYFSRSLAASAAFRAAEQERHNYVKAAEMPWEDSAHGLIKHLLNAEMNTREHCLDIYMLFLEEGGWSGKHRHLSEELLYVVEGEGYDLHWDVNFDCQDAYIWDWHKEPSRHDWKEGQFIYIPPYTLHRHFNAHPDKPARIISVTSRIVKAMGFDWFDQIEESSRRTGR